MTLLTPSPYVIHLTTEELRALIAQAVAGIATDAPMDTREAAEFLRVNEDTVLRWVKAGTIPGKKLGSEWRFLRSELTEACRNTTHTAQSAREEQPAQKSDLLALAPDQAGQLLGISGDTIRRLVADGSLNAIAIRGKQRIARSDLDLYVDSLRRESQQAVQAHLTLTQSALTARKRRRGQPAR